MLDPTRFALDAQTVGFRKRTLQSVDWDAFNEALQTQTDSVKVRRELEETPVSEIHVMGGQRFGIEGNAKTNEIARQHRQINGYVLRSFLATGGPVILPPKKNDSLLGIPTRFGQIQYTPNAVMSEQYTSAFTEPLNAPLENNTILLGRAGLEAKSNSISNPYAALQFRLNMDASQEEIRAIEAQHQQLKSERSQDLEREKLKGYKEVPAHLLGVHRTMKKKSPANVPETSAIPPSTPQVRRDKEESRRTPFVPKRIKVEEEEAEREVDVARKVDEAINAPVVNVEQLTQRKQLVSDLLNSDPEFKAMAESVQAQTHVELVEAGNAIMEHNGIAGAIEAINAEAERSVSASTESSTDISRKSRLSAIFRNVEYNADDIGADSVINFNSTTELAVNSLAAYSNKKTPKAPSVGGSNLKLKDGGFNSGPSTFSKTIQLGELKDSPGFSPYSITKRFSLDPMFGDTEFQAVEEAVKKGSVEKKRGERVSKIPRIVPYGDLPLSPGGSKRYGRTTTQLKTDRGNIVTLQESIF
jgi:hypothetical protein